MKRSEIFGQTFDTMRPRRIAAGKTEEDVYESLY